MAFEATKREWSELYTFFRLLSQGEVSLGTPQAKRDEERCWPIAMIQRQEHDGIRRYYIQQEQIRIESETFNNSFPREEFTEVARLILSGMKAATEDTVSSPDGVAEFLTAVSIYDLEAPSEDRTDLSIAFFHPQAPLTGFSVRSRLSAMNPLLDGGRTANLKFELSGVKLSTPAISNVNGTPSTPDGVVERMLLIERLGGVLKFSDVADRVFRCNLLMIDLHFPRLLSEMLRTMHLQGVNRVSELTDLMKVANPLKIKEELIDKHKFYEFKIKQFLLTLALGMRPAKIYNGTDSAVAGMLLLQGSGEVLCYHISEKKIFEEFLYLNTRFEKGALERDKYGFLEKENNVYYLKLNAKIGLLKR